MAGNALLKRFDVALDIKNSVSNRPFYVVDGDTGNRIVITLCDGGNAVDCTGRFVTAVFSHSRGCVIQDSGDESGGITVADNEITIDLFPASFAPELVECELQIYSSSQVSPASREDYDILVTSARFNFGCRQAMLNDETIASLPGLPPLSSVIAGIEEAENARVMAEQGRVSAEEGRAAAEDARETAEYSRSAAESARVSAEAARASAEEQRQSEFDSMVAAIGNGSLLYLSGQGVPSASLEGNLGQIYVNETDGTAYVCVPDANGMSLGDNTWVRLLNYNGNGDSVKVLRTGSVDYADIPHDNAVTLAELLNRLGGWYSEINGKQRRHMSAVVTLAADGWTDNTQTVTVTGMTADALVICDGDAECAAQGENSLTFAVDTVPTEDIMVNVGWFE